MGGAPSVTGSLNTRFGDVLYKISEHIITLEPLLI